jgi:hypothetical protein
VLTPVIPSSNYYTDIKSTTIGNGSVYNLHLQQNIPGIQDMVESSTNRTHTYKVRSTMGNTISTLHISRIKPNFIQFILA